MPPACCLADMHTLARGDVSTNICSQGFGASTVAKDFGPKFWDSTSYLVANSDSIRHTCQHFYCKWSTAQNSRRV